MSTTTLAQAAGRTRSLLQAGVLAGPLYVAIGAVEAVLRDGFDIRVHSLSLLANGSWGWVHSTLLVSTGLLTVLGTVGLVRTLPPSNRPRAGVIGLGVYGLGLVAAGLLKADPAEGFPAGTPDGPAETITWHGIGHLVAGGIGFLGLIVACLVFARWFRRRERRGWAVFSLVTGVYYFASFAGIASGAGNTAINLAFTVAVVLGWAWITLLMARTTAASR